MAAQRPIPSFLIFLDPEGRWRWNFLGPNGRIIARSSETYQQQQGCIRAIMMLRGSTAAPVLVRQPVAAGTQPEKQAATPAKTGDDMLELSESQIVEEAN